MLDSQTNVLLKETTCCLHVGVPLTDTAAGNQQKNPSSSLFYFFFFKRVSQSCLLKKPIKKDLKKRRPHWQGEKFFRVEGQNSPTRATLLGQLSIQYRYFLKKDSNRLLGKQKVGSARRMTHLTGSRFLGQHLGRANFSPNKHLGSLGQGKTETEHASALF